MTFRLRQEIDRRTLLVGAGAAAAAMALPFNVQANVPRPYDWNATPPMNSRTAFVQWMQANRGEDPKLPRRAL